MNRVRFKEVSKQYPNRECFALKSFSLEMQVGELVVIVGPSGSGKSTLLELICGFESVSSGDIEIDGHSIIGQLPKERQVAMVFQNYALLPHLTVYDNIAFGMSVRKVPRTIIRQKVEWAANMLELQGVLKSKPKELSGGQRQRVAVARAMVREPKLFLMDEPLSNLDAKLREHMCSEIKSLQRQLGTTMLYVTHDQAEAMTLADRMVILKDGMIQQVGTPFEIYERPANLFVARFIGRPSINLLPCEKTSTGIQVLDICVADVDTKVYELLEEGITYMIGIRSEDICIVSRCDDHQEEGLKPKEAPISQLKEDTGDTIEATVTKVNYLGSESIIYLQTKTCIVLAKVYKNTLYKPGEYVKIKLNLVNAQYFDTQTQRNIKEDIK